MNEGDIQIWNYGEYSHNNYGSSRAVRIGILTLYFSYDTVIAFRGKTGFHISNNVWSKTTAKHLNAINKDKSTREKHEIFLENLRKELSHHKLIAE